MSSRPTGDLAAILAALPPIYREVVEDAERRFKLTWDQSPMLLGLAKAIAFDETVRRLHGEDVPLDHARILAGLDLGLNESAELRRLRYQRGAKRKSRAEGRRKSPGSPGSSGVTIALSDSNPNRKGTA